MRVTLFLSLAFLVSSSGFAGNFVGNGGHIIHCAGEDAPEAMDVFAAKQIGDLKVHGLERLSLEDGVKVLVRRVESADRDLAGTLSRNADVFFRQSQYSEEVRPAYLEGLGRISIPAHCQLKLAIFQSLSGPLPEFMIYRHAWASLDRLSQIALIFHEIVLTEYLLRGFSNEEDLLLFTSMVLADRLSIDDVLDPRSSAAWISTSEFRWEHRNERNVVLATYRYFANYGVYGKTEAEALCARRGEGSRLPTREELIRFPTEVPKFLRISQIISLSAPKIFPTSDGYFLRVPNGDAIESSPHLQKNLMCITPVAPNS